MTHYVYAILDVENNLVKIGITSNLVHRIYGLRRELGKAFKILGYRKVEKGEVWESILHSEIHHHRRCRKHMKRDECLTEWFDYSKLLVEDVIEHQILRKGTRY